MMFEARVRGAALDFHRPSICSELSRNGFPFQRCFISTPTDKHQSTRRESNSREYSGALEGQSSASRQDRALAYGALF
jgi:hypothetical protein